MLSFLKIAPQYVAKTLASNFSEAAVRHRKRDNIAQFIKERLGHVNDHIILSGQDCLTLAEVAAFMKDEALLDLVELNPIKLIVQMSGL